MADNGTVVELRVHGVSGTPPEALLGCPVEFLDQPAGDKAAGFYRRQPWIDLARDRAGDGGDGSGPAPDDRRWRRVTEAYSWGGLTSGPASRAVWVVLLPFVFVNLAHWMLPPVTRRRAADVAVALLRLIALSFTLTLMLAAAVAVMDVIVWQCVGLDYCAERWAPLTFLASLPRGVQVGLGGLVLLMLIVLLWRLGAEHIRPAGRPPSAAVLADEVPLESDTFWCPDAAVARLRACHVTAWAAGLGALTLAVPMRFGPAAPSAVLMVVNAALLTVAVVATGWNRCTARGGRGVDRLTRPLLVLRWVAVAVAALSLGWAAVAEFAAGVTYPDAPTHLPGLRGAIYALLGVQVALFVALFAVTAWSRRGRPVLEDRSWRPTLGGYCGPVVALIGWLIGGAFSVGIGLLAAQLLGDAVVSTAAARTAVADRAAVLAGPAGFAEKAAALDAAAPLIVPPPYLWAAVAIALVIVVAVVAGLAVWWWFVPRRTRAELAAVRSEYPGEAGPDTAARARQVARARALAALSDVAVGLIAALAVLTVLVMAAMAVWYLADSGGYEALPGYAPALTRLSVFVTLALAAGLVLVAVQAYRDRQLRRLVAVLWDVITFWPRANHPLTPPCYSERTVPELRDRLAALTADPGVRVVLAAHSQGSVIAAATLLQYDEPTRDRVALLTFGSPLRRLYARNFPAYFGTGALPRLARRQPQRWINLWARSDPIGSWVCDPADRGMDEARTHVDFRLLDVTSLRPRAEGDYPPICGHSGFWTRAEYQRAITELEKTLTPSGAPTDTRAAPPPTESAE